MHSVLLLMISELFLLSDVCLSSHRLVLQAEDLFARNMSVVTEVFQKASELVNLCMALEVIVAGMISCPDDDC